MCDPLVPSPSRSPSRRPSRSPSRFVLAALAIVSLTAPAFAHGGSYRPPAGEIPPDSREPSDPPPPPDGDPPGTPGGEDGPPPPTTPPGTIPPPTTPDGGTGGPRTDGSGPPPAPAGDPRGPTTGNGRRKSVSLEDWQYWWHQNSAELLALRAAQARARPVSGVSAHRGGIASSAGRVLRATDAAIRDQVVPVLREVLADADENADVRSAAAIALAKIGDGAAVGPITELALGGPKAKRLTVEGSALSLGLFERDDARIRESIATLAAADAKGTFARSFALLSSGLQKVPADAVPAVREMLLGVVAGREPGEDAKPCALLGLGELRDPASVPELLAAMHDGKLPRPRAEDLSDLERSYVVQALGRIGLPGTGPGHETDVVDGVLRVLSREGGVSHTRRSAVAALGRLGPACPPKTLDRVVGALVDSTVSDSDGQSRAFALIALGRIGGSSAVGDDARRRCVDALRRQLDKGQPAALVQPWAALGLGLVGRGLSEAKAPVDDESIRRPIREKFASAREPMVRAAFGVASGLCRDALAGDGLLAIVSEDRSEPRLRGYAALALGLIGDARAVDPVRALAAGDGHREMRLNAALGAGLLGDGRAVADLVSTLNGPEPSQYVLGSAAIALGAIGDERAVEPLVAIVKDRSGPPDLTRALAVVALGRLGDRRDVPTLARIATDVNYRAQVPAVSELLTIL